MMKQQMCPICGLPRGEGFLGVPKVEGKVPLNMQIQMTGSLEPDGPPLWCLGHEAVEYIPDVPPVPEVFYEAFKGEEHQA